MAEGVSLFDLAAKISVDASQSDKALTETQKKVLDLAKKFEQAEKSVVSSNQKMAKSAEVHTRALKTQEQTAARAASTLKRSNEDLQSALGTLAPRLSAVAGAAGPLSVAAIAVTAVGAASVSAAAKITQFTISVISSIDQIGDMAAKVNFSVRTISGLQTAIESSGGSLDGFVTALGIFDKNIEKVAQGDERLGKLFKGLNIDATDNEKAFRQVAEVLAKLDGSAQQTALAMELFGRSGKDVLGVIKETGGDVDAFIERMAALGLVITDDAVAAADEFDKKMIMVRAQLDAVKRQIAMELMPAVAQGAENISSYMRQNQKEIRDTIDTVKTLIGVFHQISSFVASINPIVLTIKVIRDIITNRGVSVGDPATASPGRMVVPGSIYIPASPSSTPTGPPQRWDEPGELAVPFGRVDQKPEKSLEERIRELLGRGGGGGRGGGAQKDVLEGLKSTIISLNSEYRKYNAQILDSANATELAAEKEKILSSIMGSLKANARSSVSAIKDVDEAINAAIGNLPKKSQAAAKALVDQALAQFKVNQELKIAGDLNKKAEDVSQKWREEMDRARNGSDEYALAIAGLEKEYSKYGKTLDATTRKELEQLAVMRRELELVLSVTRAREVLRTTRDRMVTREGKDRPPWIDLSGGSTVGGEPSTTTRPRVATVEEQVARERREIFLEQTRAAAATVTSILDRAMYEGMTGGGVKGALAELGMGLLDVVNRFFLARLEEGLAKIFEDVGSSSSGGGIWGKVIGVLAGGLGGGGFSGLGSLGGLGSGAAGGLGTSFAGAFASGGTIPMGQWGIVHEGEKVVAGPRGAEVIPNRDGNKGSIIQYNTWNVTTPDAQSFARRETQTQLHNRMKRSLRT